ncbi:MAG TPA: biopolymer transporter ExbD [Kiritimatiellia bacterium]|nr:biopolymer transporter ExbD [Kiritimatiellia bacterium]
MARRSAIKPLQEINEINMTPLIDLTFLLLITFIITMPLLEQGIPIQLPRGQAQQVDQNQTRSITLDREGKLFLDNVPISAEDLAGEMTLLGQTLPDTAVLVRADETLAYGRVMDILRLLNDAQVTRMALITNPEETRRR